MQNETADEKNDNLYDKQRCIRKEMACEILKRTHWRGCDADHDFMHPIFNDGSAQKEGRKEEHHAIGGEPEGKTMWMSWNEEDRNGEKKH